MRMTLTSTTALAGALLLAACGQPKADGAPTDAPAAIPASLAPFGEGYPNAGDPCRRLGESALTANWLDDSAVLVGCPTAEAAAALGGRVVDTIEGVTLVSIPTGDANAGLAAAVPGDGDGQGDAKVEGTDYNATAEIPCAVDGGDTKLRCKAGVKRKWGDDGSTIVTVTRPDGSSRSLFFKDGKAISADGAEADGSAAYAFKAERVGDDTRISFGPERYVVPDAFVLGD